MKLLVTRRMTPAAEHALAARFEAEFLDREDGFSEAEAARAMAELEWLAVSLPRNPRYALALDSWWIERAREGVVEEGKRNARQPQ